MFLVLSEGGLIKTGACIFAGGQKDVYFRHSEIKASKDRDRSSSVHRYPLLPAME